MRIMAYTKLHFIWHYLITVPATITTPPIDTIVVVQEKLALSCVAIGIPKPYISWSRNGNLLMNSTRYNITARCPTESSFLSTLTVNVVERSDAGDYSCMASNAFGNVSTEATVSVLGKFKINLCNEREHC